MTTIGCIGTGKMAEAILASLDKQSAFSLIGLEINTSRKKELQKLYSISFPKEADFFNQADLLILAIKPQNFEDVVQMYEPWWELFTQKKGHILLSIMAGINTEMMQDQIPGGEIRVVRVMPNTPGLIGQGISAVTFPHRFPPKEKELVSQILLGLGKVVEVPEYQINAVTALSGSGPAYVYSFIQGLIDGGVLAGLPRDLARELVLETVSGATALLRHQNQEPYTLRSQVTSPGGTTIHGLKILQENGFEGILMNAVDQAFHRANELEEHRH